MTLSLMMMTAVLSGYIFLGRSFTRLANQETLEREGRLTLQYFTQDARMASEISGTPSASAVTFTIPTATGTLSVKYTYDSTAKTLTRVAGSSTRKLLSNVEPNTLYFRYFDIAGRPYDNNTSPYTTYTSYLAGLKQVSLEFSTRSGVASNGTRTPLVTYASPRLLIRNKASLE